MSITFKPSKPIVHDKKTYEEFVFEEPIVENLFAMDAVKGEARKSVALFASMAGVPLPVLAKLTLKDFARLETVLKPVVDEMQNAVEELGNEKMEAKSNQASA